ncbi:S-adenosyl-L-methionine-dependent methyltransferase [Ceratobasidium sp. AG-I]|nr:S-adenosyl-L-methionine-dependent methyltransferase [Ceratobasidium sp. AG-I]
MPSLPFPFDIIPRYLEVVQLGLFPTLRTVLKQPSLLVHPSSLSRLFFSYVWGTLGPGIDANAHAWKQPLLYPHASGVVLDVGAGHGHAMKYLDKTKVTKYVAVEPNLWMHEKIREMARACGFNEEKGEVVVLGCGAEDIERIYAAIGGDGKVDTIVSLLTLCSVKEPPKAIGRLSTVLKEGGQLLWCEHVSSPFSDVRIWQRLFSPIWGLAFDGCRLGQNTVEMLQSAGPWSTVEMWDMPGEVKSNNLLCHKIGRFVKS